MRGLLGEAVVVRAVDEWVEVGALVGGGEVVA